MSRPVRVLIFVVVLVLACGVGALAAMLMNRSVSPAGDGGEGLPSVESVGLTILPFAMVNQDGETVSESILEGEWTVVDFIFTNCPGACPVMSAKMAQASRELNDLPVRFLSLSLDQERDTPEVLRKYGESFNADFDRWTFATGDDSAVRRIIEDGLKLIVERDESQQIPVSGGGTMENIFHPTRLFLVGPDLRVYGLYSTQDPEGVDQLIRDVRARLAY